jgi:MFS transporter, putative metabolite:H+ symporter
VTSHQGSGPGRRVALAVVVAAFGYFVDIYDLILFSIVRLTSLRDLGVAQGDLLGTGIHLLNWQMGGMLVGGVIWGVLGDRRGRLSVLFGSISLYSLANIANGFASSVPMYAALRFIAGVGLAGELGAGVTLVSETMSIESRGYGTTIVAAFGILGAVVAAFIGAAFTWRVAYFVGGAMGLGLLAMRVGVFESGAFEQVARTSVRRGNFLSLFSGWAPAKKYISVICVGLPAWFVVAILVTFSPEFGQAMGMAKIPDPGNAVMFCYIGLSAGGFLSGYLSQVFRNRKKVTLAFILMSAVFIGVHFIIAKQSLPIFYTMCFVLGIGTGYWAVFMTIAAEQFGTNLRATVATTAPNFVRGAVVPMTSAYQLLRAPLGIQGAGLLVGFAAIALALAALANLDETFGRDLNFIEE